jgi:hypothetical protein
MRGQSYREITEHWSIDDLDDAGMVLDAIEDAQARMQQAVERKRG